jgi:hypothetical protein
MQAANATAPGQVPVAPAQQCSTNSAAYLAQQQAYSQAMQNFNYAYQNYMNSCNMGTCSAPPTKPSPCIQQGNVATTSPLAYLSCNPSVAEVGSKISFTFSCLDSASSTGSGFGTGSSTSGTSSAILAAPPKGTNTATYSLQCMSADNQTARAQCSVQIDTPGINFTATQKSVSVGQTDVLGWATAGMNACAISDPDFPDFTSTNASFTNVTGGVTTPPITQTTTFTLDCTTFGGADRKSALTITAI